MSNSFQESLELIAQLAARYPDYEFELIQSYVQLLHQDLQRGQTAEAWIQNLTQLLAEMPPHRADICHQLFDHALLKAKQATYQPVNELDAFLERYLYGIKDEKAVQKGTVSQALRQMEDQQRKRTPQPPPAARAGRTNPLPGPPPGPPPSPPTNKA